MKDGVGILNKVNGEKFKGEWIKDKIGNNGIYVFSSGEVYEGQWFNE